MSIQSYPMIVRYVVDFVNVLSLVIYDLNSNPYNDILDIEMKTKWVLTLKISKEIEY